MPKKETFTSKFEETWGERVPQKSKIWGDVFHGWSLRGNSKEICDKNGFQNKFRGNLEKKLGHI